MTEDISQKVGHFTFVHIPLIDKHLFSHDFKKGCEEIQAGNGCRYYGKQESRFDGYIEFSTIIFNLFFFLVVNFIFLNSMPIVLFLDLSGLDNI